MTLDEALSIKDKLDVRALVNYLTRNKTLNINYLHESNIYNIPYYYGGCINQIAKLVDIILNENYKPTYKECLLLNDLGIAYFRDNQLPCVCCSNSAFLVGVDVLTEGRVGAYCVNCVNTTGLVFSQYDSRLIIKGVN